MRTLAPALAAFALLLGATTVRGHDLRIGAPERPDAIVRYDPAGRLWWGTAMPADPTPVRPRWRSPCRDVPPPGADLLFASTSPAWLDALGARAALRYGRTVARLRGRALVVEPDGTLALVPCARFPDVWRLA